MPSIFSWHWPVNQLLLKIKKETPSSPQSINVSAWGNSPYLHLKVKTSPYVCKCTQTSISVWDRHSVQHNAGLQPATAVISHSAAWAYPPTADFFGPKKGKRMNEHLCLCSINMHKAQRAGKPPSCWSTGENSEGRAESAGGEKPEAAESPSSCMWWERCCFHISVNIALNRKSVYFHKHRLFWCCSPACGRWTKSTDPLVAHL